MSKNAQSSSSYAADSLVNPSCYNALFHALPAYGSPEFWHSVKQDSLPLEVLVRVYRSMDTHNDHAEYREQLLKIILERIRPSNRSWAKAAIYKNCTYYATGQHMMIEDLLADLEAEMYCLLTHKFVDYWEINFRRCLKYIRRRVCHSYMVREGLWRNMNVKYGCRVPRKLMTSLDWCQSISIDHGTGPLDVEDECSQVPFLRIEMSDVRESVALLPPQLRDIVTCIFWLNRTEKDTAKLLGVSDRTVRNYLKKAMAVLRELLLQEEGTACLL